MSSSRGSARNSSAAPFTVSLICILFVMSSSLSGTCPGARNGAAQDHARNVAFEFDRAAIVLAGVNLCQHGLDRRFDISVPELRADQGRTGGFGIDRRIAEVGHG